MPGKLTVQIEYCHPCDYLPEAVRMSQDLLSEFGLKVAEVRLVPSGGGRFEVSLNGALIHSKHQSGQFPSSNLIIGKIKEQLRGGAA